MKWLELKKSILWHPEKKIEPKFPENCIFEPQAGGSFTQIGGIHVCFRETRDTKLIFSTIASKLKGMNKKKTIVEGPGEQSDQKSSQTGSWSHASGFCNET